MNTAQPREPFNTGRCRKPASAGEYGALEAGVPSIARKIVTLTPNQQTMFILLEESMPHGLDGEEWNNQARAAGLNFDRRPATYTDLKIQLKRKGRCHETQGRWFVTTR